MNSYMTRTAQRDSFHRFIIVWMVSVLGLFVTKSALQSRYAWDFPSYESIVYGIFCLTFFWIGLAIFLVSCLSAWGFVSSSPIGPSLLSLCVFLSSCFTGFGLLVFLIVGFYAIFTLRLPSAYAASVAGTVKRSHRLFDFALSTDFILGYTIHEVNSLLVGFHASEECHPAEAFLFPELYHKQAVAA